MKTTLDYQIGSRSESVGLVLLLVLVLENPATGAGEDEGIGSQQPEVLARSLELDAAME